MQDAEKSFIPQGQPLNFAVWYESLRLKAKEIVTNMGDHKNNMKEKLLKEMS